VRGERSRCGVRWETRGWLLTLSFAAVAIALLVLLRESSARVPVVILLFALYALVALVTGGRQPGETIHPPTTSRA
jgi:hypothetical protein